MNFLPKHNSETPREIYLVAIDTFRRAQVLCDDHLHRRLAETFRESADQHGWLVGKYLVMPDRITFFCAPASPESDLSRFVTHWKSLTTRKSWELGHKGALWEPEFSHRALRDDETYDEKWEELRNQPVAANLCESPDEWKYQGELEEL